jgi:hypothetical protein
MLMYVGGCSNSAGTKKSLGENPWEKNLAAKLSKKLKCEIIDNAVLGNSNRGIIDHLLNTTIKVDKFPDYVVIQFTHKERFRTPYKKKMGFKRHVPSIRMGRFDGRPHSRNSDNGITSIDFEYYKQYYDSKFSDATLELELILDIKLVESYIQNLNIPYTFMIWPQVLEIAQECKLFKSLDLSRILNYENGQLWDMYSLLVSHGFELSKKDKFHFKEDSFEFISNAIIEHMNYGTKLKPTEIYTPIQHQIDNLY